LSSLVVFSVISSLAILRDSNSLILAKVIIFILASLVLPGFKDNIGYNSLFYSINAFNYYYLLLVA
jgi:hypothetical protein